VALLTFIGLIALLTGSGNVNFNVSASANA
jgi:hypothetical protein